MTELIFTDYDPDDLRTHPEHGRECLVDYVWIHPRWPSCNRVSWEVWIWSEKGGIQGVMNRKIKRWAYLPEHKDHDFYKKELGMIAEI